MTAAGLMITGGYIWWHSHTAHDGAPGGPGHAAAAAARSALHAGGPSIPVSTAAAAPFGPLGLVAFAGLPAAPAKPIGAVRYAVAGNAAYVVATGTDGVVRFAVGQPGPNPQFGPWTAIAGLASAASKPALAPGPGGSLQIFVLSNADNQLHATSLTGPAAAPWVLLNGAGSARPVGTPAAAALGGRTVVITADAQGSLIAATGSGGPGGAWSDWRTVSGAGSVDPDVALAAGPGGTLAAYVLRASDAAVMRVMYQDGHWGYAWPTGAVGLPEAAYTDSGKPYLFLRTVDGDVQVFEPTGADLRGSMNWVFAGVATQNPPGVGPVPGLGVVLTTVAPDGSVQLFHGQF